MNSTVSSNESDAGRIEARFGLRVGALLEEQTRQTPHDISERLRVAREQALARARSARTATAQAEVPLSAGPTAVLGGRQSGWLRFASLVPLILLIAGVMLIDEWHDRAQIEATADVDVALLADDLPPDAYSDAGFVEFLKEDPQ